MMCRSSTLQLIHFAEDTTIIASDDTERSLLDHVNTKFPSIDKWARVNKLSLNTTIVWLHAPPKVTVLVLCYFWRFIS